MRYGLSALLLIAAVLISSCQPVSVADDEMSIKNPVPLPWMLHGVVLDLGNPGEPDDKSIESPKVIRMPDGTYTMWYRGQTFSDDIGRIMRATSMDGIIWKKQGIVMVPQEEYEGNKIDPMTVMFDGGVYKLWYGGDSQGGCACYATSGDGIHWVRYSGNPVLKKTSGSWDKSGAGGQHTVIKEGARYSMYYKGYSDEQPGWTYYGLAESNDGVEWTKMGKMISPDPDLGETTTFRNLCFFKADNYFCIMHTMVEHLNLYLQTSLDGRDWKRHGDVFPHGQTPGGYDEKWSTSPCVLVEDGWIRMWYEGGDRNGRVRVLYAEINKRQFLQECKSSVIRQP